jgi:hypothetical protein
MGSWFLLSATTIIHLSECLGEIFNFLVIKWGMIVWNMWRQECNSLMLGEDGVDRGFL